MITVNFTVMFEIHVYKHAHLNYETYSLLSKFFFKLVCMHVQSCFKLSTIAFNNFIKNDGYSCKHFHSAYCIKSKSYLYKEQTKTNLGASHIPRRACFARYNLPVCPTIRNWNWTSRKTSSWTKAHRKLNTQRFLFSLKTK